MDDIPLLADSDRQDLYSTAYIEAIVAAAGYQAFPQKLDRNSIDLLISHYTPDGRDDFIPVYEDMVIQIKCTYVHTISADGQIHFPLPVNNYNQLRRHDIRPRILVVVLVPRPEDEDTLPWIEWIEDYSIFRFRAYWVSLMGAAETTNLKTVTISIPSTKPFDVDAVHYLMDQIAQGNKQL